MSQSTQNYEYNVQMFLLSEISLSKQIHQPHHLEVINQIATVLLFRARSFEEKEITFLNVPAFSNRKRKKELIDIMKQIFRQSESKKKIKDKLIKHKQHYQHLVFKNRQDCMLNFVELLQRIKKVDQHFPAYINVQREKTEIPEPGYNYFFGCFLLIFLQSNDLRSDEMFQNQQECLNFENEPFQRVHREFERHMINQITQTDTEFKETFCEIKKKKKKKKQKKLADQIFLHSTQQLSDVDIFILQLTNTDISHGP